ncbi:hypothetical protein [Bradyrhizobium sp. 21]|uniref:hypothetical protein n=1 Tax=Bradyrhizobium sp. 21 TaxID=2782666 RepID=UPI001FF98B47|nr:hypothetical protein [Bradyrhizobium sp. 21]MCK1386841.1 hypothetical protein [Bradyrhizobium sp. 21]
MPRGSSCGTAAVYLTRPGLSREVIVMMVPPRGSGTVPESAANDFSASKRAAE